MSARLDRSGSGNGYSREPVISANGRFVAFVIFRSNAANLTELPGITPGWRQYLVYSRDLTAEITDLVSQNNRAIPVFVNEPLAMDQTGRLIAFVGGIGSTLYIRDLERGTNVLEKERCYAPALSQNGRYVAYQFRPVSTLKTDVWITDLQTGAGIPVSVDPSGALDGYGDFIPPAISGDGRYVVFKSQKDGLVPDDANTKANRGSVLTFDIPLFER